MSSFKFLFFGWLFASQKKREMHSISRPEFAMQTRAFQGSVRTSCYLHSFATLRNWLRQPLQSLPRFKIKKLEIEPIIYLFCSRDIDQKKIDLLFIDEKGIIPIEIKKEIAPKNPTKKL